MQYHVSHVNICQKEKYLFLNILPTYFFNRQALKSWTRNKCITLSYLKSQGKIIGGGDVPPSIYIRLKWDRVKRVQSSMFICNTRKNTCSVYSMEYAVWHLCFQFVSKFKSRNSFGLYNFTTLQLYKVMLYLSKAEVQRKQKISSKLFPVCLHRD